MTPIKTRTLATQRIVAEKIEFDYTIVEKFTMVVRHSKHFRVEYLCLSEESRHCTITSVMVGNIECLAASCPGDIFVTPEIALKERWAALDGPRVELPTVAISSAIRMTIEPKHFPFRLRGTLWVLVPEELVS